MYKYNRGIRIIQITFSEGETSGNFDPPDYCNVKQLLVKTGTARGEYSGVILQLELRT